VCGGGSRQGSAAAAALALAVVDAKTFGAIARRRLPVDRLGEHLLDGRAEAARRVARRAAGVAMVDACRCGDSPAMCSASTA
jgi:hypothetical protein